MAAPRLLLATTNAGKVLELRRLLRGVNWELVVPSDLALALDVQEGGDTFKENAVLKARAYARASGLLALADDSGIEVEALGGAPGVHSARYGGPGLTDEQRMHLLVRSMAGASEGRRACRYVAVAAVSEPDGQCETFTGTCDGVVARQPAGSGGFGYDPVFYIPHLGRTIGELSAEAKDVISHRGGAVRQARLFLDRLAAERGSA